MTISKSGYVGDVGRPLMAWEREQVSAMAHAAFERSDESCLCCGYIKCSCPDPSMTAPEPSIGDIIHDPSLLREGDVVEYVSEDGAPSGRRLTLSRREESRNGQGVWFCSETGDSTYEGTISQHGVRLVSRKQPEDPDATDPAKWEVGDTIEDKYERKFTLTGRVHLLGGGWETTRGTALDIFSAVDGRRRIKKANE